MLYNKASQNRLITTSILPLKHLWVARVALLLVMDCLDMALVLERRFKFLGLTVFWDQWLHGRSQEPKSQAH